MKRYNIVLFGCTEPTLFGPYISDEERLADGKITLREPGIDPIFKLDVDDEGIPAVYPYVGGEIDDNDFDDEEIEIETIDNGEIILGNPDNE